MGAVRACVTPVSPTIGPACSRPGRNPRCARTMAAATWGLVARVRTSRFSIVTIVICVIGPGLVDAPW